jgi:nitrite reductase (NADH) small subunit
MPAGWLDVGCLEDLPQRGARLVILGGVKVAVFRTAEDEIFALIDRCPHKGGPLSEGIVSGRSVTCPLHNWVIDLSDGKAREPDIGCVPMVPVMVTENRILLSAAALMSGGSRGEAA